MRSALPATRYRTCDFDSGLRSAALLLPPMPSKSCCSLSISFLVLYQRQCNTLLRRRRKAIIREPATSHEQRGMMAGVLEISGLRGANAVGENRKSWFRAFWAVWEAGKAVVRSMKIAVVKGMPTGLFAGGRKGSGQAG